jgi:hypothetical protein
MQVAGVSEKDASVTVGATPEVIRRRYDKLGQMTTAHRNVQLGLADEEAGDAIRYPPAFACIWRAGLRHGIDSGCEMSQVV